MRLKIKNSLNEITLNNNINNNNNMYTSFLCIY